MKLLRNPEVRRGLLLWAAAAALLAAGAAWTAGPAAAGWVLAAACGLAALHLAETRRRYRQLARLAGELEEMLHGAEGSLERYREGELAILQNQLAKMVSRLREQAEALGRDKRFLADAMADLSHQLRTPLTSLELTAALLAREPLEEGRRRQLTGELRRLLQRVDWLVETMLKLSRLDAGTVTMAREPVDAAELVAQAAAPLAVPLDLRDITLTVEAAGGETFTGDMAWSVEALGNILKNCMEHTPPGGAIRVQVRQTPIFTEIAVADTGPGIAPEDLPRLFERFYRGRRAGDGSVGIGLALARQIVAMENGTIQAANGRGGGAVFTLRFYHGTV